MKTNRISSFEKDITLPRQSKLDFSSFQWGTAEQKCDVTKVVVEEDRSVSNVEFILMEKDLDRLASYYTILELAYEC